MKKFISVLALFSFILITAMAANAGSTAVSGAGAVANNNQTFEGSNVPQGFSNGVETNFPTLVPYFGPDVRPFNFTPIEVITAGKSLWKRYECNPTIEDAKVEYRFRSFVKTNNSNDSLDSVDVMLGLPEDKVYTTVAHITLRADDVTTTSLELLAQACLLAMEAGGKTVAVIAQGAERVAVSSGWGVGFNSTASTVNNSGDIGTVSSGGTGYSKGTSGLAGKPWLQVFVLTY